MKLLVKPSKKANFACFCVKIQTPCPTFTGPVAPKKDKK